MTDNKIFEHLDKIIDAITHQNYPAGEELIPYLDKKKYSENFTNFIESLSLMVVKLEARDFALEKTIRELQCKNKELQDAISKRDLFSTLFNSLFISTSVFIFLLFFLKHIPIKSDYSARVVEFIFLISIVLIIKKSRLPLFNFGLTTKRWKESILQVLPATLLICSALVAGKAILYFSRNSFASTVFLSENFNIILFLYVFIAFIQEFIARGVLQTAIEYVLVGKYSKQWSILTTSCLFGLAHIQISYIFSFIAFLMGLFWGTLYFKSRTIIGVGFSHFLIGGFFYILGFWDLLIKI